MSRRRALTKALRERHLRPISEIARATLAEALGIENALTMPAYRISAFKLVTEANAMRGAASLYEEQFRRAGRPADFLERLDAAGEAVRGSVLGKARELGRQVGAGAWIATDLRRGRMVVDILDTIVRDEFYDDNDLLAEWRSAKRVRAVPGGAGVGTETTSSADASPEVPPLKLVTAADDSAIAMSA